MNQCAQCAQEIHESATLCESCRRAALERLFDEASLTARPLSVEPAATKPAALLTAGTSGEPAVTESPDVSLVPVERPVPAVEAVTPASDAGDALRPQTVDELTQLTPPVLATPAPAAADVSAPRVDSDLDEWTLPDFPALPQTPTASSLSSLSTTAPDPPPVEEIPLATAQSAAQNTLPAQDFLATFAIAPLESWSAPARSEVSEPAVSAAPPIADFVPAVGTSLASDSDTVSDAPLMQWPEMSVPANPPVPDPEPDVAAAPAPSLDEWWALQQRASAPTASVEARPLAGEAPIELVTDPLPSAAFAAVPAPHVLASEPPSGIDPSLEIDADDAVELPEIGDHAVPPAPESAHVVAAVAPPAAQKAKKRLGAREFALIAMTLLFGGTVTFAMLRASANRQPAAAPVAPARTVARASKPAAAAKPNAAPKPAPAKPAAVYTWTGANRDWVGNQKRAAAFEVLSNNRVATWMGHAQPILVVRCMAKRTDAFVFIESAAQIEPQPGRTVRIRFDDEPESEERWPDSDAHDALFAPDGPAFTQRLLNAQTFHFGYKPHNSPKAVAEFNVSGLAAMLTPVAKECAAKK